MEYSAIALLQTAEAVQAIGKLIEGLPGGVWGWLIFAVLVQSAIPAVAVITVMVLSGRNQDKERLARQASEDKIFSALTSQVEVVRKLAEGTQALGADMRGLLTGQDELGGKLSRQEAKLDTLLDRTPRVLGAGQ